MRLDEFLQDFPTARVIGTPGDAAIGAVRDDSRAVQPGDLFVAVRGTTVDGHQFVPRAVAAGAAVVVAERELDTGDATLVIVPDSELALGLLAARAVGRPGDAMDLIAVTGTNGKTTTSFLIEAMLAAAGRTPGVIGTVNYRYAGHVVPAPYTTPTPLDLHRVFRDMADAGCTDVVAETSSAALAMGRLAGVAFRVGVFTNLTQDHLDVHGSMAAYLAAKQRLFAAHIAEGGAAIAVVDDPAGAQMLAATPAGRRRIAVSAVADSDADVRVASHTSTIDGIAAAIDTPRGRVHVTAPTLIGAYNVTNIAVAVAVAEALELDHSAVVAALEALPGVPGRVERVANDAGLDIVVDYAHTPDALVNVLAALRPLARRRLICVFGCGGDRDPTKRIIMGRAVADVADLAVVTSDNPRTEQPDAILQMILDGVPDPHFAHRDRRTAIRAAIADATPGDIVLIAGKGHEDYQIIGTEKVHFDDREEAAAAVAARVPIRAGEHAFSRVVIDSRIAAPGDLYVAIRGEQFDGHAFTAAAVDAGATGVLVEPGRSGLPADSGAAVIEAEDTRVALGHIARDVRRAWGGPIVGVTGSAGKTTTKDLLAAALSTTGCALATKGSLNNETGVPLTLLRLGAHFDYGVIEMGMRGLGQIDYLCELAEPTIGIVTNAGVAHVGVVGSVDDIARGKAEMFQRLPADGCAIYPADDPRLARYAQAAPRRLSFGTGEQADVQLTGYEPAGVAGVDLRFDVCGTAASTRLRLVGRHNALNATCAMAAAFAAGVAPADAARGLALARAPHLRGQLAVVAERNLLIDCYNSNPAALAGALETLVELRGSHRALAVLGDMLELGANALDAHVAAGAEAAKLGVTVVGIGEFAAQLAGSDRTAADPETAAKQILDESAPGDWVLIKASRGLKLERVVEALARVAGD